MLTTHTNLNVGSLDGAKATTQLSSHDFNSYCRFGDNYLACGSDGLSKFTGNNFDGNAIRAYLQTFNNRFGHSGKNRVRFIYLLLETYGSLNILLYVDDVLAKTIPVTTTKTGRQKLRVTAPHNVTGVYWSFRIENVGGCWFSLEMVEALPIHLSKGR